MYSPALRESTLFRGFAPADIDALADEFDVFDAARGHVVFNEGDPANCIYVVLSGKVKVGRRAADGRENLVAILGPPDQFGELSLFDPEPRTETAVVVTGATIARLPASALQNWVLRHPEIAMQLLHVAATRLRRTNAMLADLIFIDVPGRVAKQLLQLAYRFGSVHGAELRVTHDLTQEELAQLVGASRETVNKALGDFATRGWLRIEPKGVVILDPERLARRAG